MVGIDQDDGEVITALRAEVTDWRPKRVPALTDIVARADRAWLRPAALTSAVGAAALAVVLMAGIFVGVLAPATLPGIAFMKDHLVTRPFH